MRLCALIVVSPGASHIICCSCNTNAWLHASSLPGPRLPSGKLLQPARREPQGHAWRRPAAELCIQTCAHAHPALCCMPINCVPHVPSCSRCRPHHHHYAAAAEAGHERSSDCSGNMAPYAFIRLLILAVYQSPAMYIPCMRWRIQGSTHSMESLRVAGIRAPARILACTRLHAATPCAARMPCALRAPGGGGVAEAIGLTSSWEGSAFWALVLKIRLPPSLLWLSTACHLHARPRTQPAGIWRACCPTLLVAPAGGVMAVYMPKALPTAGSVN